jgi:hypothetical protein
MLSKPEDAPLDIPQESGHHPLGSESRLVMRTSEEAEDKKAGAQVPVEVTPGHPAILEDVAFPDDLERILLLGRFRVPLEQARAGAAGLLSLREELLRRPDSDRWVRSTADALRSTTEWAAWLLSLLDQHDPLKRVLAVRDDFLGVYQYEIPSNLFADEFAVNRATIRLYWGVIGLVAEWIGCTVEDLAIVVLTHELAHAYSQLGADIEGRRWQATVFSQAERGLKEGLAQYYTERTLRRLERRYGSALKVYEGMLPKQPAEYRTQQAWADNVSPEAVRRAMLEVRRWRVPALASSAANRDVVPCRT